MLKQTALAALSLAALSLSPVTLVTTPAYARCSPNATYCPPSTSQGSTASCSSELGYLRRVYEEELESIDDSDRIFVTPICSGEDYGVMRSDGNAGALRQALADNDAIMEALLLKNFGTEDVVGIRMTGEESAVIFVHEFHR